MENFKGGLHIRPRGVEDAAPYKPKGRTVESAYVWTAGFPQEPICLTRDGRACPAPTVQQKAAPILYRERRGLFVCSYTSLNSCPLNGARVSFNSPPQALPTSRFGFSARPPKHCQSVSSSFVSLPARGRVSV